MELLRKKEPAMECVARAGSSGYLASAGRFRAPDYGTQRSNIRSCLQVKNLPPVGRVRFRRNTLLGHYPEVYHYPTTIYSGNQNEVDSPLTENRGKTRPHP